MTVTRHYALSTQTNPGTGASLVSGIYDLSTTLAGAATNVGGIGSASETFVEYMRWQVGAAVVGTSFPYSVTLANITSDTLVRFRVQRVDQSNIVQASSNPSTSFTTNGTKTGTLTLSTTWAADDRLAFTVELQRVVGAHGNKSVQATSNTADSYVDADVTLSGFTGTVAETQDTQTLSAAGHLAYTGNLSETQDHQTLAAAGAVTGPLQFVRPVSDRFAGNWTNEVGAASNLFASVDETVATFDDHIRSDNSPATSPVVLRLAALTEPAGAVGDGDVQMRVQYDKEGAATSALVVQLRQGYTNEGSPGILIASTTDSDVTDAAENIVLSLTAAEHATITYTGGVASDLDVRITADLP